MYKGKYRVPKKRRKYGKTLAVLLSVVLVIAMAAGVTIAFLADSTNGVENTFTPSQVTVEVNETFDGKIKSDVSIKNTGNTTAYIRAAVVVTWQNANGVVYGIEPVEDADYKLSLAGSGWFKGADGYYYHSVPVAAGANTGILIDEITAVHNNAPATGYFLSVEIIASGIQSVPASVVTDSWKVSLDTNGNIAGPQATG